MGFPFIGTIYFISNPTLWGYLFRYFFWMVAIIVISMIAFFWSFEPSISLALLFFVMISMGIYLLSPIIQCIFFEQMVRSILQKKGLYFVDQSSINLTVFLKTLGLRIGLCIAAITFSIIFIPLAPFIKAICTAYIWGIDGCDLVLSIQGKTTEERLAWIKGNRSWLKIYAISGALLYLLLAWTLIGYILWLPSMIISSMFLVFYISRLENREMQNL